LTNRYWRGKQQSLASAIGVDLCHPQKRYAEVLTQYLKPGCEWLDVGCGRQIVPQWALSLDEQKLLASSARLFVGIDVDELIAEHPLLTHRVKAFGDRLPFRNSSFDIITANMVMEHVQDPEAFLSEVKRVLRPHGMFLFHTPNYHYYGIRVASLIPDELKQKIIWVLEKRHAEDVFPTFYRINTLRDIQIMASNTGFAVERLDIEGPYPMFGMLGPAGIVEILGLKVFSFGTMRRFRSNFIVGLRKAA
jgi:2-polyprenyl-3-methyl-5-hydroxy-6-metoxy-1,4-benzoquinol methylase